MKRKIFFRADGNVKIGLGHVIRSLALADMLREEFECHFIIQNPLPTLQKQILEVCESIIKFPETTDNIEEAKQVVNTYLTGDEIVVLDGYHFITEYQQIIKERGCKVVCIDDIHAYHFVADVVINHAPDLSVSDYSVENYTQLCLGLDYSLLRKPFLAAAQNKRKIKKTENIFICFGGSDINNVSLKILQLLEESKLTGIKEVNVVLGGANDFRSEIIEFVNKSKNLSFRLHSSLSANEMCSLMQCCQLAIVPASSILFEIVAVKMAVISGYYVDNQINIYEGFKKHDLIIGVGDFNQLLNLSFVLKKIEPRTVKRMIYNQNTYVTGQSGNKINDLFITLAKKW